MNAESLIAFAKTKEKKRLPTLKQKKSFSVTVSDDKIIFIPKSGHHRPVYFSELETFCAAFENRKSWKRTDYPETQNGSYLLGLVKLFHAEAQGKTQSEKSAFSDLTKDSIQKAIEEIDHGKIPPKRQSVHYDLIVDGKPYPPKYVISLAAKYVRGIALSPDDFDAVAAKNYFISKEQEYGYKIRDRRLENNQTQKACDFGEVSPERVSCTTYRILRDTELARQIKLLHDYKCQICGHTIRLSDGSFYAEAHHIRPLGSPHNGPDTRGNIICVCPNCHAELDYGVRYLFSLNLGALVDSSHIEYHNQHIYKKLDGKMQPTPISG